MQLQIHFAFWNFPEILPLVGVDIFCLCLIKFVFIEPVDMEGLLYSSLLLLSHFSRVRLCATPQTAAHQAPPSLGFSRQEHWSGLPFPSPVHESEK